MGGCIDKKAKSACQMWAKEVKCEDSACEWDTSKRFCPQSCKQCSAKDLEEDLGRTQTQLDSVTKQGVPRPNLPKNEDPGVLQYVMTALTVLANRTGDTLNPPDKIVNVKPLRFHIRSRKLGCEMTAFLSSHVCNSCGVCESSPASFQQDLRLTLAPQATECRIWFMQWNKSIRKQLVKYTPTFLRPKLYQCKPCEKYDHALANSQAVMRGWADGVNAQLNRRYFALCEPSSRFERDVPPRCCL